MAVPAVWRLINLLAVIEPKQHAKKLTGETPVLLSQNPKASCFWYDLSLPSSGVTPACEVKAAGMTEVSNA